MRLNFYKNSYSLFLISCLSATLLMGCGGGGGGSTVVEEETVPVEETAPVEETSTFDGGLLKDGGFESASDAWSGNASNPQAEEGNATNTVNFSDIAVASEAFNVNLSQMVEITSGRNYTLKFDVKSNRARTILAGIGLNEEPFTNYSEIVNLTSEWQIITITAPAAGFGGVNSRILFDMGADTGEVQIDNVSLVDAGEIPATSFDDGLLADGDFENGVGAWFGNAANVTEELLGVDGSKANFANIMTAAENSYDVNLSQIVPITLGKTYTLIFKAKSDVNRTIIAGIGLNEGDYENTAETVNLTTEFQTITLTQTATFGSANSRVLFDMGAETGVVIIDEVSLLEVTQ